MKFDFALRTLFVVDLWLAMSVITSIILELTILPAYNGIISLCIFAGGILINLIVTLCIFSTRKAKLEKNKQ